MLKFTISSGECKALICEFILNSFINGVDSLPINRMKYMAIFAVSWTCSSFYKNLKNAYRKSRSDLNSNFSIKIKSRKKINVLDMHDTIYFSFYNDEIWSDVLLPTIYTREKSKPKNNLPTKIKIWFMYLIILICIKIIFVNISCFSFILLDCYINKSCFSVIKYIST